MRRVLLVLAFCGFAASLWAADAFVGTWKFDMAKSKLAPSATGAAVKEWTIVIGEKGTDRESYAKATYTDGSSTLDKWTVSQQGGIVKYQQGGPAAGGLVVVTRISGGEDYWTFLQNGKQVETGHWTVSKDGKMVQGTIKSIDGQGKPFEGFAVGYKQ
jgi:hypothetical protein